MNIDRIIGVTFLGHLLNHSLTLVYPVIIIQLLDLYPGVSLTTLGAIGTVHYLLYGVGAFPAGWLTDRLGARNVLLFYLYGSAAAVLVLVTAHGLNQLALGLALLGLACALYHPAGLTLISHSSKRISKHLGVHGMAGSLGLALGPLVGGLLVYWFGWTAPYLFFGGGALALAIYISLTTRHIIEPAKSIHAQSNRATLIRPLIYIYITGIFMGLAHRGALSFMPLHLADLFAGFSARELVGGGLTSLVLACGILGQLLGGRWGDQFPRQKAAVVLIALNIPLLTVMTFLQGASWMIAALMWGVMSFAYQPVSNALISDFSNPRQRGMWFGIFHGLSFGVGALASTLAGAVGDYWGTAAIFAVMGLLLLPAAGAGVALYRLDLRGQQIS